MVLDDGRLVGRRSGHRRLRIQRQLDERHVVDRVHAVARVRGRTAGIAIRSLLLLLRRQPRVRHLQQEQVLVHVVADHVVINFRCNSVVGEENRGFSVKLNSFLFLRNQAGSSGAQAENLRGEKSFAKNCSSRFEYFFRLKVKKKKKFRWFVKFTGNLINYSASKFCNKLLQFF